MKKLIIILLLPIVIAVMAKVGMASDSTTVTVSASVTATCKCISGGSITFTLDPATGGDAAGTVTQPTFWCTNGTTYTITDNNGQYESGGLQRTKHASLDEYIPYSFT